VRPVRGSRPPERAALSGTKTRLGAEDIPENTRPGPAARWKGR
jgi:hypothetical protein